MSARCLCSAQSWGFNLREKTKKQGRKLKFNFVETMCVNVWSFSRHTDVSFLRGGKTQNKKKQKNASQCFLFPFSRLMLGAVCGTVPKGSAVVQRPASSPYTPLQRSRQRRPPEHTAQSHFLSKRNRLALSVEKKRVRLMWCSFNSHRRHHITL